MTAIVKCYDRQGNFLDTLNDAQIGTRSWVLNRIGDLDFRVLRNDPKATETNLGKMNLIIVESDTGVPDWGGRVRSVDWSDDKWLFVECDSKESLLRRHVIKEYTAHKSAGAIINDILQAELADTGGIPGLSLGTIDTAGDGGDFTIHGWDIWDRIIPELLKITEKESGSPEECWVDADGTFNWKINRGTDKSADVILRSGYHILKWSSLKIDYSKLITQCWGFGNAVDWTEKAKVLWREQEPWDRWSTLEGTIMSTSNTTFRAEKYARNEVRKHDQPDETLDFMVVNRGSVWSEFWVGDTVRVVIPHIGWQESGGFDGEVKVTGIEIQEKPQKMRVIGTIQRTMYEYEG